MHIIPLSEGVFTVDQSKIFIPFNKQNEQLSQRPTGSILLEVQPFAVITSKDILLLDAGLGFSTNGEMQLHQNLKANNINPDDVTKVLITHLHKDHAGGISKRDNLGNYTLAFPNATYYVQRTELEYAQEIGFPSYMTEELLVLENNSQVILLEESIGTIDDYIHYEVTGAHSPYHQVFWIKENKEEIFFGGDDAPQLHQMKSRFIAKYDYDGRKCAALRTQWWQEGEEKKWTFLFYHDVKSAIYKMNYEL